MRDSHLAGLFLVCPLLFDGSARAQDATRREGEPFARFSFEGNTEDRRGGPALTQGNGSSSFVRGLDGQALRLRSDPLAATATLDGSESLCEPDQDFSVQFWVRTTAERGPRMVLLSNKVYEDNSLRSQKVAGWAFYLSEGTWAWTIGSGNRRLTYERENGSRMPLDDGRWHQLTMTYDSGQGQVWLYYDGENKAAYNLKDSTGFDFSSPQPLVVGWPGTGSASAGIVPAIHDGAAELQELVDAFASFELDAVQPDEFLRLIVEPERLFDEKVRERARALGDEGGAYLESMGKIDFGPVSRVESQLMRNPFTVHQAPSFLEAAPLLKIYSLVDGEVVIDEEVARRYSARERLDPSDFDIDDLSLWKRTLSPEEVRRSYGAHFEPRRGPLAERVDRITVGVWNIFHGGLHFTEEEHGWDSRRAIAQIIERQGLDVLMMQETYSGGDFIAAELGFHFATTVDWDYLNQGANISVLSRYPIRELRVPPGSSFMNVAVRVQLSATQDAWVMSNWYGMQQFADVFEFHQGRFATSETTPVFFGGDFNAVPHTDGGSSPASKVLLDAGFTDVFRHHFPDVEQHPGYTHRSDRRIDQLFTKGATLHSSSASVLSTWPIGFPSDHYLIRAEFELR